ncbi:ABC transporter substrate-binding protein [Pseudosulfitobacter pseudonitzschiae]|uniref:Branched-chain amino acid ABC transporter substrate-binding protein n=1 Tax=Pseudosulfitobacter pseudonitzschiae TaxID=1402135 RepID=A0A073J4L1_9RHOB|nr:ABC transporter substrate-binding protein [Pseudosulfitobacter pseudonitzschiae]KEJ97513.1 branched-chain amino acid ABC transporter substrate-binding protein [Pseudosulfitobacter pseudonitzschiae]MBM1814837.1 ABC transporter substrate-binding protein [Pseudosulfitobacter pseudonitzschiae]MBM1831831.1 ABC transporter substrate-binding protein [Pseudosulfitobacter pseudonitzschiae]MBM1836696.1 ABC transporter substrate-binding protein [Pseudosulfitobacter pseudonitzschiae]MBM1841543.1 ABC tr
MKKFLMATAATALMTGTAFADAHAKEVKIGVILGFTGPLESITPAMGAGAELAMAEVTDSGALLDGAKVVSIRGDSTCIDAGAATSAAERLITSDKVSAIMGADCSGVTGAILQNAARPNGIVMISPSATSPGLSTAEDDGLFFRTAPSDARQGVIMTEILQDRGVKEVALTYTNNDYGKGLADAFQAAFEEAGGTVTIATAHEDGKADYSAEVGALASAGGEALVVAGYVDQGGSGIVRSSIDSGAFDTFYFPDGMVGEKLNENFGAELNGSFGAYPGTDSEGAAKFLELATAAGFDGTGAFAPESYDAAALIMLAMQAANSMDSADFKDKVMDVANAPGEKIYPGELAKALELIKNGEDVDYEGASAVELIGPGESAGNYQEIEFADGKYSTIKYR